MVSLQSDDSSLRRLCSRSVDQRTYNQLVMLAGGALTATVTGVLFTLPVLIPFESIQAFVFETTGHWLTENPLIQLRFFGGIPGAFLAGYAVKDEFGKNEWGTGIKYAILTVLLGLVLFYFGFVGYITIVGVFGSGPTPTIMYLLVVSPLLLVLPLFPFYLMKGFFFGLVGVFASRWRGY